MMVSGGAIVIRPSPAEDEQTLIIVGLPGTGTTITAIIAECLGIPMTIENNEFQALYEDSGIKGCFFYWGHSFPHEKVNERNAAYKQWGFKFPQFFGAVVPNTVMQFRKPRVITLVRDVVAIVTRYDALNQNFKGTYIDVKEQSEKLMLWSMELQCPTMFLSTEKLMTAREKMIAQIANFCGVDLTQEKLDLALRLTSDNTAYRNVFNITQE